MAKPNRGAIGDSSPPADEGFLERWSRRKAEAKLPTLPAADADLAATETERSAAETELSATTEPPATTELSAANSDQKNQLPTAADIDEMGAGSDFSVFMQAGVPPALRTKALRKLWRVKPELANLDGLLDYGEDLTGSFKVVDHLKTAYEVGKGFLRDVEAADKPEENVAEVQDDVADDPAIAEDEDRPVEIDQKAEDHDRERRMADVETPDGKRSKG